MDHLNGQAGPTPKDFLDQTLLSSLMEPCAVPLITPSTHRNVGQNGMVLCGFSMQRELATAGAVLCVHSVKKTALPSSLAG
jgi:hypothetical protein